MIGKFWKKVEGKTAWWRRLLRFEGDLDSLKCRHSNLSSTKFEGMLK
jgi:hypothetical protein